MCLEGGKPIVRLNALENACTDLYFSWEGYLRYAQVADLSSSSAFHAF